MAEGTRIQPDDLELVVNGQEVRKGRTLRDARESVERELILAAIEKNKGNLTQVARDLDISRPALYDLIKKLDIRKE